MAQTVASHAVAALTSPVNGDPLSATVVLSNDNTVRAAYVDHDADSGIHVQSSALASRPAFGSAGRKWLSADTGSYRLFFDTGTAWQELSYLRTDVAGTFTQTLTVSGTFNATGAVALSPADNNVVISPTGTGVVTINPATAGTINNVAIGGTTRAAGAFTTLAANGLITSTAGISASGSVAHSIATSNASGITVEATAAAAEIIIAAGVGGSSAKTRIIGGLRPLSVESLSGDTFMEFVPNVGSGAFIGADSSARFYVNDAASTTTPWFVVSAANSAIAGGTFSTSTALALPLGTTAISSLRIPHGAAPTSPVNGDMWTTTAGLFVRINGSTIGPLS